jgi:hypothetical protein
VAAEVAGAGAAEAEVAEEEGVAAVEVAGVLVAGVLVAAALAVGVLRAPRCNQHRWHECRSSQRRCHQCRSNQRLGRRRGYLARSERPTRSLRRRPPLTIGGRQHCRCHVRDLRNLHRPLMRRLGRCRLFQTDPPPMRPGALAPTSPSCRSCRSDAEHRGTMNPNSTSCARDHMRPRPAVAGLRALKRGDGYEKVSRPYRSGPVPGSPRSRGIHDRLSAAGSRLLHQRQLLSVQTERGKSHEEDGSGARLFLRNPTCVDGLGP